MDDFLGPLIYLNDSRKFTIALGLAEFTGLYSSQWHLLMAASTVVIIPVVILFFSNPCRYHTIRQYLLL